ncbi:Transcription repressor OFP14 [Euphorbia peplus]|nr:Transcription repressor OFP14 [Euphorbia peplus]
MPKKFKSIQEYISKVKTHRSFSSIISGCRHPRTASFAVNRSSHEADHRGDVQKKDEAATLYDIDQFLLENFKSLYVENSDENRLRHEKKHEKGDEKEKLDLPSHMYASHRFFVPIGPSSSSLIEEARLSLSRYSDKGDSESSSTSSTTRKSVAIDDSMFIISDDEDDENSDETSYADGVFVNYDDYMTVKTYSWNPYNDFLASMEEMIEAKLEEEGKVDWEFMEELLVCYLSLNEKKSRKFIISAFVDLVTSLRQRPERVSIRHSGGHGKLDGAARERDQEGIKKSRNAIPEN